MSTDRERLRHKIQVLSGNGESIRCIAQKLNISRNTVRKWVRKTEGDVKDAERSGKPSKFSPRTKRQIREWVKDKPGVGTRTVAKRLNFSERYQAQGKKISHMAISQYLRNTEWGKKSYVQPVKPMLTPKNISDRVRFCNRLRDEGFADDSPQGRKKRAHVLFTDESPVELFPTPNRQNHRVRTSSPQTIPPIRRPKFGLQIMVAGGISRYGKTELVVVDKGKTVDSQYYQENILPAYLTCLKDKSMFPVQKHAVLMQDGAKCHTAKSTIDVINRDFPGVWTDWPGNSPDLNVIEHVWSKLQDSVFREPRPRDRETLIQRVKEEWSVITQEECKNLVESFRSRILQCLENNGLDTDY